MKKEEKTIIIQSLVAQLAKTPNFYLADTSGLNAERTAQLRKACFDKNIKLIVVKNTLLRNALQQVENEENKQLYSLLEGPTSILFTDSAAIPAKLIKEFGAKHGKPVLKGAYLQECAYVGAHHLDALTSIKSREDLIGDIIGMLQSPIRNIISGLTTAGANLTGIAETLGERE
ncbi:MAG: 50S ribosomal protein L10 [Prevotellaceae bacterium]|jgi:large subunit ribosomal protein L10|nr:50S ribosomal protein L10 [Prevotellaceae bacterium]